MQNKHRQDLKAMGIHLPHNIRILKIKSKNFLLRPDLAPSNLLFSMSFVEIGSGTLRPYHALVLLAPISWYTVSFCTSNASVRTLKKAWEYFSKLYNFHNLLKAISFQKNISSSFFHYFYRTVACTETNNPSSESFGS